MTSRSVQELLLLVIDGTMELPFEFPYVPWSVVRAMNYVKMIRNVHQRVQYDANPESAMPLRHMWLSGKRVDAWFSARRESQSQMRT